MQRRAFLQSAGLAALGAAAAQAAEPARPAVFVAGAGLLAGAIAELLAPRWSVRAGPPQELSAAAASIGVAAVVNVNCPPQETADAALIDLRTRGTYDLLQAATAQGVRQCVHLSSIEIMDRYDARYQVTEDWRPVPAGETQGLSHYLAEFVCREFAREGKMSVAVLRLGRLSDDEIAQAVSRTLEAQSANDGAGLGPWAVFHVVDRSAGDRFPMEKARRLLGYPTAGAEEGRR